MMVKTIRRAALGAGFLLFAATSVSAQIFTPTYMSPRMQNDLGLYVSDGPGDLALEGIWRGGPLGLRVGYVDAGDGMVSIGGELRTPVDLAGVPLGLAFTASGQGIIGDNSAAGIQAGLSAGYTFVGSTLAITPYLHPRIGAVNHFGGDSDLELEVMADVGVDVEIERNLVLRLGVNLGEPNSVWGVGLAIRR
ncbi:MAG TPA: hypothetical protein VK929_03770 [Longimicrobiales bacterium]|nr:hypothetical protein [Longimicrobiales bacterium]